MERVVQQRSLHHWKSWRHAYLDQTEFVQSCTVVLSHVDLRETVVSLGTVARTPQLHEHVLVVSCIGASLLLSTTFTLSVFFVIFWGGFPFISMSIFFLKN